LTVTNNISDWHHRYVLQAGWTSSLRNYIFDLINLSPDHRTLEVGCGTGALLAELENLAKNQVFGIDLSMENIRFANNYLRIRRLTQGDGHALPFASSAFDITLCHFLLLWVISPLRCVQEMRRVTRKDGWVIALAEPDYGGRIDHPASLAIIGQWQREALANQGANVELGRQLLDLFNQAGLINIHSGVLGGQWSGQYNQDEWQSEWNIIEHDLQNLDAKPSEDLIEKTKKADLNANEAGKRILFVPTFYALGQAPD
jgi:SAM-dependent methyltransferase